LLNFNFDFVPDVIAKENTELIDSKSGEFESHFKFTLPTITKTCYESVCPSRIKSGTYLLNNFDILNNLSFQQAVLNFYDIELKQLSYILNLISNAKVAFEISPRG